MKDLLIKLGLWEEDVMPTLEPRFTAEYKHNYHNSTEKVEVDAAWYEIALKHYCGTCEQWFKTASIANHNRFKHKDETGSNQPSA